MVLAFHVTLYLAGSAICIVTVLYAVHSMSIAGRAGDAGISPRVPSDGRGCPVGSEVLGFQLRNSQ